MRLIDADAIAFRCNFNGVCMSSRERCLKCQHYVCDGESIKNEPIAYNLDAVVEELEEQTDFLKDCTKYGNKNAKQQEKSYSTMMMYEVAGIVEDLIDIVRRGGVTNE